MKRVVLVLGAMAAVAVLAVVTNIPYGPIDLAEAERLSARAIAVEERLHGDFARIDVIAPDGTWAQAPVPALGVPRLVECPILRSDWGEIRGNTRFSSTDRELSDRSTTYGCLLEAGAEGGAVLRLGVRITRSDDPELDDLGGYEARVMDRTPLRDLMAEIGVVLPDMARVARRNMRAGLEAQGVVFRED